MALSIIAAVMSKVGALTAAGFPSSTVPKIYMDVPPAVDTSGAQVRVPYIVIRDNGLVPSYLEFERVTAEVNTLTLEVYYLSLADVDTAVLAIKLNGGTRAQGNGLDFGSITLTTPRSSYQILRTRETRNYAGFNQDDQRVHVCKLEYKVTPLEAS